MKTCPVCDVDFPDQHNTCPQDGATLIVSHELESGSLVRSKYRIQSKLGQGGMGVVYLAEHILLGGRVALKFLAGDLGKDPKFIKRFRMEARAAHQLRHPNIVEVIDLDQAEDGSLFIAMEYVQGKSLRQVLDEARGGLDVPRALEITRGIASGLAAAHAQGTVHRDIKPENILLTRAADGHERAKVLDFGIAAMADSSTRVSRTHGFLLTPDYAAPEQWEEMPADQMDGRTDLYALGCVFYEMLTGQTPFHAHTTSGWMFQHLQETPPPPSDLRPDLGNWPGIDGVAMRLLAKNRDDRPQDAELLSQLDDVQYGAGQERRSVRVAEERWTRQEPVPQPMPVIPAPQPAARKFPGWAWAALAILALAAAVAAVRIFAPPQQAQAPMTHPLSASQPVQSIDPHDAQLSSTTEPVLAAGLKPSIEKPVNPQEKKPAQVAEFKPADVKPPEVNPVAVIPPVQRTGTSQIEQQAIALYNQKRYSEASPLLEKVCTLGSWEACKDLGNLYHDGNGVAKDGSRAATLYSKACDAAPPRGCNSLGVMYRNGDSVAQSDGRAADLYSQACDAGDAIGCSNLGSSYWYGRGVPQNDVQAATLYSRACDAGNVAGCSSLGNCYRFGRGVEKNPDKARQWFTKGCNGGNQWGCDRLKEMK